MIARRYIFGPGSAAFFLDSHLVFEYNYIQKLRDRALQATVRKRSARPSSATVIPSPKPSTIPTATTATGSCGEPIPSPMRSTGRSPASTARITCRFTSSIYCPSARDIPCSITAGSVGGRQLAARRDPLAGKWAAVRSRRHFQHQRRGPGQQRQPDQSQRGGSGRPRSKPSLLYRLRFRQPAERRARSTSATTGATNYNGFAVISNTTSTPRYLVVAGYLRF